MDAKQSRCFYKAQKSVRYLSDTSRFYHRSNLFQHSFQVLSREAGGAGRHLLRRTGAHNGAAAIATLGAEVNEMVGALDNVQIVLDNHHGVPRVHQTLQHFQQLPHIVGMEAGSRLI